MKKLHELSDKAQRKAIKTIRELLSCGFYMHNSFMFIDFIRDNYSRSDIINFWNKYCESEDNEEQIVYPMEQFTATFGDSFQQIFPRIIRFSVDDKYFQKTDNGLIFTYADESHVLKKVINFVDLLSWLAENPQDNKMKVYIEENIKKNN